MVAIKDTGRIRLTPLPTLGQEAPEQVAAAQPVEAVAEPPVPAANRAGRQQVLLSRTRLPKCGHSRQFAKAW